MNNSDLNTNVRELKDSMSQMKSINSSMSSSSSTTSSSQQMYNRSMSAAKMGGLPQPSSLGQQQLGHEHHHHHHPSHHLKRHGTSPAIMELPNPSPTDSLEDNGSGMGPYPIVTSPVSDMAELAAAAAANSDLNFSDGESSGGGGLTSPNLVSSTGIGALTLPGQSQVQAVGAAANGGGGVLSSKFGGGSNVFSQFQEARKMSTSSKTKIITDGKTTSSSSSETATANASKVLRLQTGDGQSYEESTSASAMKARLESGGTVAEKSSGMKSNARRIMSSGGELVHAESNLASMSGARLQNSAFGTYESASQASSSHKTSMSSGSGGTAYIHSSHHQSSSSKKISVTRSSSLLTANQITEMMNTKLSIEELETGLREFHDLESLTSTTGVKDVENALVKYCGIMSSTVGEMKKDGNAESLSEWMSKINDMMTKAWEVPAFGYEIGNTLCDIMRNNGGLDILIDNCVAENKSLQYNSAKLLQQCLVTENRGYVVEKGLEKVVEVAKNYTKDIRDVECSRVGTGILEHLFKHSESTCGEVIAMGGLDTVVNECKSTDVETLRHCASALANVAMYGGAENQEAMIKRKVPSWLFPLAFHNDDTIKYYACLAIAALVANKEIEAAVQRSGTLDLIEPFVQSHTPKAFAETSATHSHGQSPNWLKRLIPVLMSHREEARNLAAFHFCMEAEIKRQQAKTGLFSEIGAIESLKKVASSPQGIASTYAAQTLRLIGEEVPHKLSQQVPTWSVDDVKEWVKQIGFPQYSESFVESRVDGDLLLQLSEEMLKEDITMRNGILRRRFLRELTNLKRVSDYSSCDPTNLNEFLQTLGAEYSVYTYDMINAGIDRETLMNINDEQLLSECGIKNKIHRLKIQQGVKVERGEFSITDENGSIDKNLDVFISYRRSNGSQLASLLKVHLEIRNFSVFLDVDRLEAGKFDNNLLQSIRSAKNFILVLTPGALDRCFNDHDQHDWIHKEIACALTSQCNIIPIFDNFSMPDPSQLPETMRPVTSYNGVKWIHDYQEACVEKIDRFIRGDSSYMMDRFLNSQTPSSAYGGGGSTIASSSVTNAGGAGYNRQNTYQRNISQDNSSCSDENATLSGGGGGGKD